MPLKLIPPKKGRSPYWYVRGTYLRVPVDRSTKTDRKRVAQKFLERWQQEIERGEFAIESEATFLSAAVAYMKAGGDSRPMSKLVTHFGITPLRFIDQGAIDAAALVLFPEHSPATRNREVYTPVSAVLKHGGIETKIRRPKGSRGRMIVGWLWPEEAQRLFEAAAEIDRELSALLILLCYTGLRLSEALKLKTDNVRLSEGFAYIETTKNTEPRPVFLPPIVVTALANHPRGCDRPGERLFRFSKSGRLYMLLDRVALVAGVVFPERAAFHLLRHTYATWMRRYAGRDTKGLVGTGAWKSEQSASRYAHVVPTEDAMAAALLPTPINRRG